MAEVLDVDMSGRWMHFTWWRWGDHWTIGTQHLSVLLYNASVNHPPDSDPVTLHVFRLRSHSWLISVTVIMSMPFCNFGPIGLAATLWDAFTRTMDAGIVYLLIICLLVFCAWLGALTSFTRVVPLGYVVSIQDSRIPQ